MILNYKRYGRALGLRSPFSEEEVIEEMKLIEQIKHDREQKLKTGSGRNPPPKAIELTGKEFLIFNDNYNSMNNKEFKAERIRFI